MIAGLDARVGTEQPALEFHRRDLEAGGGQHWLEQPPERAELGADVFGVVIAGVPGGGIGRGVVEPAPEHLGRLARAEVVDQVAQPEHPAGTEHPRYPVESQGLPEVGQLVKRVPGVHPIGGRTGMLVAEEPGHDAIQVRQSGGRSALAKRRDHGRRDVDRRHVPEPARRGERELARSGAKIDDGGAAVQAVRLEYGQVFGRVGIPLLAVVTGDEGRVEVFGSRVGKLVDHPGVSHEHIVPRSRNSFLRVGGRR